MQKKTDRRVRKTKTQLRNGLAMLMKEKSVGVYHALLVKCNKRAFPILVHSFIDGKVSKGYN